MPKHKLQDKWTGPFVVMADVPPVAHRLRLPTAVARIFDTFHVSQLRPYKGRNEDDTPESVEPRYEPADGAAETQLEANPNSEYEVEKVLEEDIVFKGRQTRGTRWYLVKFYGWITPEWVLEKDMDASKKIQEFNNSRRLAGRLENAKEPAIPAAEAQPPELSAIVSDDDLFF